RLVGGVPIALDTAWLPARQARPLLEVDFTTAVLADEVRDRCGLEPDEVEEQICAAVPTDAERELLAAPPGVALLQVSTVSRQGDTAYECRRVGFRADRIHLTSHWRRASPTSPTLHASTTA